MARYNFSYTVAKGIHFCKDCLRKLSDLKKGGTHTPHPLAKYEEFSPDQMKFEMRTLQVHFEKYKESGDPRFTTVKFSSLFRGTGPVILKTTCMPIHISLGVVALKLY